jgi:hypothetical protein
VTMTLGTPQQPVPVERLPGPRLAPTDTTRHDGDRVQTGTRVLLVAFVVFTLLAVNQLLVLGDHTDRFFAWPIASRPASAFLGAAYAAGAVLSALALRQGRWSHVRVAVLTVTAFTVLTLVPTLLHRHRLNLMEHGFGRTAAVVWIMIYVAVPVAGTLVVVRQERSRRPQPGQARRPMPAPLVGVLMAQGAALTAVGAALYASGFRSHLSVAVPQPGWPWPVTPLTSQVIGAWLLSFGIAIALAIRERDVGRMLVPAVAYAAFGIVEVAVLLYHRGTPGADPLWLWVDAALFATLIPVGLYGAWAARRQVSRPLGSGRS